MSDLNPGFRRYLARKLPLAVIAVAVSLCFYATCNLVLNRQYLTAVLDNFSNNPDPTARLRYSRHKVLQVLSLRFS